MTAVWTVADAKTPCREERTMSRKAPGMRSAHQTLMSESAGHFEARMRAVLTVSSSRGSGG